MQILIDEQKPIEVNTYANTSVDDEQNMLVPLADAYQILSAWEALAPGRRGFRYGSSDDGDYEPTSIYVAEATDNRLEFFDIEPWYDGSITHNAYRLVDLEDTLPIKVVES